jgi:hypothetical protein
MPAKFYAQPQPARSLPGNIRLPLLALITALCLGTVLFIGEVILRETGWRQDDWQSLQKAEPLHKTIGSMSFTLPALYIRSQGLLSEHFGDQVVLGVKWPDFQPILSAERAFFDDLDHLYITLAPVQTGEDTTERLNSVYKKVLMPDVMAGPLGLKAHKLDPRAGYDQTILYYDPVAPVPFVALCTLADQHIPGQCMRTIHLSSGVAITYRFRPDLLKDWSRLDDSIFKFLTRLTS